MLWLLAALWYTYAMYISNGISPSSWYVSNGEPPPPPPLISSSLLYSLIIYCSICLILMSLRCTCVICSYSASCALAFALSDSLSRRYIWSKTWPRMGDWCTHLTAWSISAESSSSVKVYRMWLRVCEGICSTGFFYFFLCFFSLFFLYFYAFIIDYCISSII